MQGNETANQPPVAAAMGSGARLRSAREARHIDVQQVANELRLPARHIEALEAEDLSRLPEPSYICGYLRSYSKMMELPSDEIVAQFPGMKDYLASVKSTVMPTRMVAPVPEMVEQAAHKGFNVSSLAMIAVAVVVGALLLFQLLGGKREQTTNGSVAPESKAVPETTAAPSATPRSAVPPATEKRSTEPKAPAPVSPASVSEPKAEAPAETPVPKATVQPPKLTPGSLPLSQLVLSFRGDSWVELFDATNLRLAFELVHGGEVRTFNGAAPFHLLLGDASEVDIRYNDVVYDMAPYRRANLVELRIGKPEDNRALNPLN